jgi:hypothetical protein
VEIIGMESREFCPFVSTYRESLASGVKLSVLTFNVTPQRFNRLRDFERSNSETIGLVPILHEIEDIVVNVATKLNVWSGVKQSKSLVGIDPRGTVSYEKRSRTVRSIGIRALANSVADGRCAPESQG